MDEKLITYSTGERRPSKIKALIAEIENNQEAETKPDMSSIQEIKTATESESPAAEPTVNESGA